MLLEAIIDVYVFVLFLSNSVPKWPRDETLQPENGGASCPPGAWGC